MLRMMTLLAVAFWAFVVAVRPVYGVSLSPQGAPGFRDVPREQATPQPTSQPTPDGTNGEGGSDGKRRTVRNVIQYVLDPSEALKDLIANLIKEILGEITNTLNQMSRKALEELKNRIRWSGRYERAGRLLMAVSQALFVPMAVLRLVWYHKNQITDDDSLAGVLVEWVTIGLLVVAMPRIVDWTGVFSRKLALVVLDAGSDEILTNLPSSMDELMLDMTFGGLFLLFLTSFITFVVFMGLIAAYFALQAASFVFATLAPFLLSLSMMPPFRFLRRILALGYVVILVAPAVMVLALLALSWVPLGGSDWPILGLLIRLAWAASVAGLVWKLAGLLMASGLDAFKETAGAFLGAVKATISGLTGAGLVAASVATGGIGAVGAVAAGGGAAAATSVSSATGAAGGSAATAGAVGMAGETTAASGVVKTSSGTASSSGTATSRGLESLARAETLARMAHVVGGPGSLSGRMGAALAGYYRTLRRERMAAEKSSAIAGEESARPRSHQMAYAVAQALDPDFPQSYRTYIRTLDRVQEALKDVRDEQGLPVMPHLWSQQNDPERAALAGALVAMYWRESENFEKVLKEEGWPALRRKAEERLKSLEERNDAG